MTNNPAQSVEFYDGNRFEYTNPDGEIHYGKIQPSDSFDWEENAPENWEEAEPFILAEYYRTPPAIPSTPHDFTEYLETHYEISTYLALTEDSPGTMAQVTRQNKGIGGLYELAKKLTDQFTEQHAGTLWGCSDETDFFDVLAEFMREKENQQREK